MRKKGLTLLLFVSFVTFQVHALTHIVYILADDMGKSIFGIQLSCLVLKCSKYLM